MHKTPTLNHQTGFFKHTDSKNDLQKYISIPFGLFAVKYHLRNLNLVTQGWNKNFLRIQGFLSDERKFPTVILSRGDNWRQFWYLKIKYSFCSPVINCSIVWFYLNNFKYYHNYSLRWLIFIRKRKSLKWDQSNIHFICSVQSRRKREKVR